MKRTITKEELITLTDAAFMRVMSVSNGYQEVYYDEDDNVFRECTEDAAAVLSLGEGPLEITLNDDGVVQVYDAKDKAHLREFRFFVPMKTALNNEYLPPPTFKEAWEMLGNTPVGFDGDDEAIDENYLHFKRGTPREEIWHWLEKHYDVAVGDIMAGEVKAEDVGKSGKAADTIEHYLAQWDMLEPLLRNVMERASDKVLVQIAETLEAYDMNKVGEDDVARAIADYPITDTNDSMQYLRRVRRALKLI